MYANTSFTTQMAELELPPKNLCTSGCDVCQTGLPQPPKFGRNFCGLHIQCGGWGVVNPAPNIYNFTFCGVLTGWILVLQMVWLNPRILVWNFVIKIIYWSHRQWLHFFLHCVGFTIWTQVLRHAFQSLWLYFINLIGIVFPEWDIPHPTMQHVSGYDLFQS